MKYLFFFALWIGSSFVFAQTTVDWTELSKVRYVRGLDLRTGYLVDWPRFSRAIKNLKDKEIEISGYILPLDIEGDSYVLSQNPYAACFFCGGAGLESVMDIWFAQEDQRYKLDQFVKLRGTLRLRDDGDGLIYLLEHAVEVK